MPSQALDMAVDSAGTDFRCLGNLTVGHTPVCHQINLSIQIWELLPIGGAESLCTEGDTTGLTCKPLYTTAIALPFIVSGFLEFEIF